MTGHDTSVCAGVGANFEVTYVECADGHNLSVAVDVTWCKKESSSVGCGLASSDITIHCTLGYLLLDVLSHCIKDEAVSRE